jgi:hypothetical protein
MNTYSNIMTTTNDVEHLTSLGLKPDSFKTSCGSEVFAYHREIRGSDTSKIILVLIHGYPQT